MAFKVTHFNTNEWKARNMQLLISGQYIRSRTIYKLLLINGGMSNAHI